MTVSKNSARTLALLAAVGCFGNVPIARAQTEPLPTRMISVEGVQMRVLTAGLNERRPGQPVVVLEAGADTDLETWKPILPETARLAPVVAYDRRGLGRSGADTEPPTLKRSVQTLHALLQQLQAPPPYLLVGHSWGGLIIRGFSDLYTKETVGLVYLDVPDFETTRQERAAVLPVEERQRALGPPDVLNSRGHTRRSSSGV